MILSIVLGYLSLIVSNIFKGNHRFVLTVLSSLFLVFVLGFRFGFMTDYNNYIGVVERMYRAEHFFGNGFDPFFDFVVWLSFNIGAPEYFVLTLYFCLTLFLLVKMAWSNPGYPALSFVILLFVAPLGASLNITRQVMAFSFVLIFLFRFCNFRFFFFEVSVLLVAYLVHESVLIMLPLRLLLFLPARFSFWLASFAIAVVVKQFSFQIIGFVSDLYVQTSLPYYRYFVDASYLFTNTSNTGVLQFANIMLALWVSYRLPEISVSKVNAVVCKAYIVGVFFTFIFLEYQAFVRIFQNLSWFAFMAIPIALKYYREYWVKVFSVFGILLYSTLLVFVWLLGIHTNFDGGGHHIL